MEINPNRPTQQTSKVKRTKSASKPSTARKESSGNSAKDELSGLSGLDQELSEISDVRQSMLEEGERLAKDPNYPNKDDLKMVGDLFLKDHSKKIHKESEKEKDL